MAFQPKTIKDAAQYVAVELRKKNMTTKDMGMFSGMGMRNGWNLWAPETPIKRDAVDNYGIAMAYDLSLLITDWAQAMLDGVPFDPQAYCRKTFDEHWKRYNNTSLGAGDYNEDGTVKQEAMEHWNSMQPKGWKRVWFSIRRFFGR